MPDWLQRLLRRGPKYGTAQGVAVLRSSRFKDSRRLSTKLTVSAEFAEWAADHGVLFTAAPESLTALDEQLDEWANSEVGPSLSAEVGIYLGTVIVRHVPEAEWVAWPNGHPVARLRSGTELDVFRMADLRLQSGRPHLADVYRDALTT